MQKSMPENKKWVAPSDPWPEAYPNGKEAFIKALRKASKSSIFDVDDGGPKITVIIKNG